MPDCKACGVSLPDEVSVCPECGMAQAGATQSFEPVGSHPSQTDRGAAVVDADSPALVVRKGPQPGERFYLERDELSVGRDPESDIFLNDMTVSRTHATLHRSGVEVSIRDAGSLNGTYVNGVCVDSALLQTGDVVQIGTFQMTFIGDAEGAAR